MSDRCFLENNDAFIDDPQTPYAVLPLPYERTVSYGHGAGSGPNAILDASIQLELFDEEMLCPLNLRTQTLPPVDCATGTDRDVLERIRDVADNVFGADRFLMSLGGEHTVSLPLVEALSAKVDNLSVLQLDAHADMRDSYQGNRYSHACVMRRIADTGVPVIHVGIRSLSGTEYDIVKNSAGFFPAASLVSATDRRWISDVCDCLTGNVYVSVDIDCLDPGQVPGTGTPEPGGLSWYDVTALLKAVCRGKSVAGADVVEVAPVPGTRVSEFTAARLAAKIMLYHRIFKT